MSPTGLAAEHGVERLLVRLPCAATRVEALPAVDPHDAVTVSLTDATGALGAASALAERGYLVVGAVTSHEAGSWIDVVIAREVLAGHTGWRTLLAKGHARVLHPSFGPVAAIFGPVLAAHAAVRDLPVGR